MLGFATGPSAATEWLPQRAAAGGLVRPESPVEAPAPPNRPTHCAKELPRSACAGDFAYGPLLWTLAGPWRQQAEELTQLQKRTVTANASCIRPRPAALSVGFQVSKSECAMPVPQCPSFKARSGSPPRFKASRLLIGGTTFLKLADWQAAARTVGQRYRPSEGPRASDPT